MDHKGKVSEDPESLSHFFHNITLAGASTLQRSPFLFPDMPDSTYALDDCVQMSEKASVTEEADLLRRCGVTSSVCPMRVWSQTRLRARCALRPEQVLRVPPSLRSDTARKIPAHQLF